MLSRLAALFIALMNSCWNNEMLVGALLFRDLGFNLQLINKTRLLIEILSEVLCEYDGSVVSTWQHQPVKTVIS